MNDKEKEILHQERLERNREDEMISIMTKTRQEENEKLRVITKELSDTRRKISELERTKEALCERLDQAFKHENVKVMAENDGRITRSKARRAIQSLSKAIKFEWEKPQIVELTKKLERIRGDLSSEVLLNIKESVEGVADLLLNLTTTQTQRHVETRETMVAMTETHDNQLRMMDSAALKRHNEIIGAINSFTTILNTSPFLFPALPKVITDADPSLKPAALTGYDAIENAVLAALYFRKMDSRETQIAEAYKNTCAWIFEDPAKRNLWANFRTWLENDQGCYWIEGKAGCGKSTLMKFLHMDGRTQVALKQWSGSNELIVAPYFFWLAGTPLQKNQEGLLRALLHAILDQRRDLISRVFPRLYNAMMTK